MHFNKSISKYCTTKLKSMSMQMISDKMHFDTVALRQKNAIWKVEGYNIRSVYVKITQCHNNTL